VRWVLGVGGEWGVVTGLMVIAWGLWGVGPRVYDWVAGRQQVVGGWGTGSKKKITIYNGSPRKKAKRRVHNVLW